MSVSISTASAFKSNNPTKLFDIGAYASGLAGRTHDVSLDGRRFLMIKQVDGDPDSEPPKIVVVQNWTEDLKRRVPTR